MKTKKLLLFAVAINAIMLLNAQSDFKPQIGVSLKASTNGLGGDVYFRPLKTLAVKAGYEAFNVNLTAETLQPLIGDGAGVSIPMPTGSDLTFDLGAKFKTGALALAVGYQPFGGLYLTAGISQYLFNLEATATPTSNFALGSYTVSGAGTVNPFINKNVLGVASVTLKPTYKIAPYFGIGLGSFVPRSKRVSFAFEIGAYYMGALQTEINLPPGLKSANIDYGTTLSDSQKNQISTSLNSEIDGAVSDLENEINTFQTDINTTLKPFVIYPVIKLTIGIKAYEFK